MPLFVYVNNKKYGKYADNQLPDVIRFARETSYSAPVEVWKGHARPEKLITELAPESQFGSVATVDAIEDVARRVDTYRRR